MLLLTCRTYYVYRRWNMHVLIHSINMLNKEPLKLCYTLKYIRILSKYYIGLSPNDFNTIFGYFSKLYLLFKYRAKNEPDVLYTLITKMNSIILKNYTMMLARYMKQ